MNINEISVWNDRVQKEKGIVTGSSSASEIGKKVSGIQDKITLGDQGFLTASGVMNGYEHGDREKADTDVSKARQKANQDLAILTGEDCKKLEEEGDSLIENTREYVENAVKKNKEQKAYNEKNQEQSLELREKMREDRAKREAMGFSELKSESELRAAFKEAGIAVTSENLEKAATALEMCETALDITEQTKYYMLRNELAPTLENLYQGKYTVYTPKETAGEDFEAYEGQLKEILVRSGLDTKEGWKSARWLFEHELPVSAETIENFSDLEKIAEEMTPARAFAQILFTMSAGIQLGETLLDDSAYGAVETMMEHLQEIADEEIVLASERGDAKVSLGELHASKEMEPIESGDRTQKARKMQIPLLPEGAENTDRFSDDEKIQITLKRQLEEIRQKMTMQAAVSMERRDIHVETEPLEHVIRELRSMENEFVAKQLGAEPASVSEPEYLLLQETLEKANDISGSFAGVLGGSIRQHALLTVNELHAAVRSEMVSRKEWSDIYETVQTQVRADLGDSIKKAFEGIPALLGSMGLEDTEANERAVRILGYNRMEITEESINEVKTFDAKVNQMLSGMKPVTVLELIRKGENPLDTPIDELNEKLRHLNEEKNMTEEEKYGKYLWMLERDGQISEEERSGYIGIYRLLHQIEKSDGAVIGALVESGREMTLGNLLTQVRIRKSGGINKIVDDASGAREVIHTKESITEQIEKGFSGSAAEDGGKQEFSSQMAEYYEKLISDSLENMSPSKLQEMTEGDIGRLLEYSVEHFSEELKRAHGNPEVKQEYYEAIAEEIRNGLKNTEAAEELLAKLSIPETVGNLMAANDVLVGNENVYKEIYERRKILEKKTQEEFEEVMDEIPESIDSAEELEKNCMQAEKIMEEVLTKSYESADITFEDLQKFRQLGRGIRLQAVFRESKSYDIPICTGDTVTSLNLTIIRGADETGKVQISMEDGTFGRLSLDFKVLKASTVKGLVLCSERQGFEALRENEPELKDEIEQVGFSVKNISYGMDFKSRNELIDGTERETDADTSELYRLAKVLVRQITQIIKEQSNS